MTELLLTPKEIEGIVSEVWRMSSYVDGDENKEVAKAQAIKAVNLVADKLEEQCHKTPFLTFGTIDNLRAKLLDEIKEGK